MLEHFGFMNTRHFCHTEDVKNIRFSGSNILGSPMRMGFFFLDTGGTAQAFFAEKNRDAVADLYLWDSDEDREKFKECHRAVAITLRLMSCTETIDVEMMERHNTYTSLLAKDVFPFMRL